MYAIGDIHGRADLLSRVFDKIDRDLANDPVDYNLQIFLGDYVDRGPCTKDVLDLLIRRRTAHHVVALKGNHEEFLLEFLSDPTVLEDWVKAGGVETLSSYGVTLGKRVNQQVSLQAWEEFTAAMPSEHLEFIRGLRSCLTIGDIFFAHAGARPGVPLEFQEERDLLWIREDFLSSDYSFGKLIVHGHTPVANAEWRANRINLDTGAYATGKLTCLRVQGGDFHVFSG